MPPTNASPGTPAWIGTAALVARGLRLIQDGDLDGRGAAALPERLGITDRHLRRLFRRHLGAPPAQVERTQRLRAAKKLIDETDLPFTEVAHASGFGSIRRFNAAIHGAYKRTPSQLRQLHRRPERAAGEGYRFLLAYRPPYDWPSVLRYLRDRAIPGVESVGRGSYRRTIELDGETGTIQIESREGANELVLQVQFPNPRLLLPIVNRVRRMFDLECDPAPMQAHLGSDPLLGPLLRKHPGVRVPGAWDGFELGVRAVVGQQVTLRGATTLLGRIAERYGQPLSESRELNRAFPTPAALGRTPLDRLGLTRARAATVRRLASAIAGGEIDLRAAATLEETVAALLRIPGVGDWTAQYIAMRACGDLDAFPDGDLGLQRASGCDSARSLARLAEPWRPWRAYAAMLLWQEEGRSHALHGNE